MTDIIREKIFCTIAAIREKWKVYWGKTLKWVGVKVHRVDKSEFQEPRTKSPTKEPRVDISQNRKIDENEKNQLNRIIRKREGQDRRRG